MKRKIISLIEDDVDGVEVLVEAPTEEMLNRDASFLWEAFSAHLNKGFCDLSQPSVADFNEEGGYTCSFNASYPIRVAREIVEDWLAENSPSMRKMLQEVYIPVGDFSRCNRYEHIFAAG